jgi:hypothetical protein
MQGRGGELLPAVDAIARGTALVPAFAAYVWTVAAMLAAEAGDLPSSRVALDRVLAGGLDSLPESVAWLPALFSVVEAAARLDDAAAATDAISLLERYADLPIMGSLAIVCFGSVRRTLGLARRTAGDLDGAIAELERAVAQNERLAHLPMLAIARADLAETLARRGGDNDIARAAELLDEAIAGAVSCGLDARVAPWRARRAALTGEGDVGALVRHGGIWELRAAGEMAVVPDTIGMRHLATLLERPGTEVRAIELVGAGSGRTSVQEALRRALANVESGAPGLAGALSKSIRTGPTCRFDPVPGVPREWKVVDPPE